MDRSVVGALLLIGLLCGLSSVQLVPVSLHMLLITAAVIYIGSRMALKCWRIEGGDFGGEDARGVETHRSGGEQMATKDAMMFPLIGSCVLFSLYCVYKFLPKEWVNVVIRVYFFLFGVLVLAQKISQILSSTLPVPTVRAMLKLELRVPNPTWAFAKLEEALMPVLKRVPGLGYNVAPVEGEEVPPPAEFWLPLSALDILALLAAVAVGVVHLLTGSWLCSNLFGIAFSLQGIEMLSLGSYLNGCILLCGLFVYDIFWVFGTEVMVTVAKSFDAPIKLLFPQFLADSQPSMLGLGDIVIPGIFLALLLRFDVWRNIQRLKAEAESQGRSLSKQQLHDIECLYCHAEKQPSLRFTYFYTNLLAYVLGLATTVGVMYAFRAAQPALLYLVPACLGASALVALLKGEMKQLWNYVENEEEETDKDAGAKDAAAAAPAKAVAQPREVSVEDEDEQEEESTVTQRVTRQTSNKKKRSVRAD